MKIAQIAPLYETIPPKLYGGTERVVANLCDSLCDLGHDVVLFAADGARTKARLISARDQALRLDPNPLKSEAGAHLTMLHEVRKLAAGFDVLHFHTDLLHFPLFEAHARRTVTTLHGRLDITDVQNTLERWAAFGLVSISDSQRATVPEANWLATVKHGVAPEIYTRQSPRKVPTSLFSGVFPPKSAPTSRSGSHARRAFRSRSRPRSIRPMRHTSKPS